MGAVVDKEETSPDVSYKPFSRMNEQDWDRAPMQKY